MQTNFHSHSPAVAAAAASSAVAVSSPAFAAIDAKFAEFKAIADTRDSTQKKAVKELKVTKLQEAYSLSLPLIQAGNSPETIKQAMTRIAMILGELGILHYGVEPDPNDYPDRSVPKGSEFALPKQILLGALRAFLVSIDAHTVEFDFNSQADLRKMVEDLLFVHPELFEHVQPGFCQADKDVLISRSTSLPPEQRTHLSRMLRWLNGSERNIRNAKLIALEQAKLTHPQSADLTARQKSLEEADRPLTINLVDTALAVSACDPNEHWEVVYNDSEDSLRAKGIWTDENDRTKRLEVGQELLATATQASQPARVYNKFFRDADGVRRSLDHCLGIFQKAMQPDEFAVLQDICRGNIVDPIVIQRTAKRLHELDLAPHGHLNTDWFAIVPSNLVHRSMREGSTNLREMEGLIRLASALVHPSIRAGELHVNHQAVMSNWENFCFYAIAPKKQEATALLDQVNVIIQTINKNAETPVADIDVEVNLRLLGEARQKTEQVLRLFEQTEERFRPIETTIARQLLDEKLPWLKVMLELVRQKQTR